MRADLHVHSTASDGCFTPAQLNEMGRELRLDYLALTDHDTLHGLNEWPADSSGPRLIPGVEISCAAEQTEIHLLAYGAGPGCTGLETLLRQMQTERQERMLRMVEALKKLGLVIPDALLPSGASVGRPHLARAMVQAGLVATIQDAFNRYLCPGRPAYIPRVRRSPALVLRLLREWGAVPVLAHPGQYSYSPQALYSLLKAWQQDGLTGLEVYHSANQPPQPYLSLAKDLNLLITGGSDFHGIDGRHSPLGSQVEAWQTIQEDMERLLRRLEY